ncbi:diacylglycerol kinase family protein [Pannus brasiliensis CCIBt3594]|uniref:Diacylglycerol kinase family protein n=1 Tax=Pannus brasiliensis CCIBt3594 TaxID=1427578 RepID=A0AAW9QW10_9CHRO
MFFSRWLPEPTLELARARAFRSACLIFNPVSGQGNASEDLQRIRSFLEPHLTLDIRQTTPEIPAETLAREAIERGTELLIASGGDGTVTAVASTLIGTGIPLAIVPRGTANAFATGAGLPTTIESACLAILQGATLTVDTARCNDRVMLLLAGIGFEADTVRAADRQLKDRFGIMAYIMAGLERLQHLSSFNAVLETDRVTISVRVSAITVANFAPPTSILAQGTGENEPDDGLLDVTLIAPTNALEGLVEAIELWESGLVRATPSSDHHIGYLRVKKVRITTDPPQAIALDGENLDPAPVSCEIVPASLSVVVAFDTVAARRERLAGLPDLAVVNRREEPIESIVLNYEPAVDIGRILTDTITELATALLNLRSAIARSLDTLSESISRSLLQVFRSLARSIDGFLELFLAPVVPEPIEIVHRIPGRIRLRIPGASHDADYLEQLRSRLESIDRTRSIEINPPAASIVVTYPPEIPGEQFERELLNLCAKFNPHLTK